MSPEIIFAFVLIIIVMSVYFFVIKPKKREMTETMIQNMLYDGKGVTNNTVVNVPMWSTTG